MSTNIASPQDLQITLMRMATFNEFDGDVIADSLLEHSDLWESFILDREAYGADYSRRRQFEKGEKWKDGLEVTPIDLIRLRDLSAGYWNVDALYILPAKGKEKDLELLVHSREWCADEIHWVSGQDAAVKVLRVWWD